MFKPNKSSRLPKVWRNVKTKRKKRLHSDTNDYNSSDNDTKNQIVCFDYGELPDDPELITCDDEVALYCFFFNVSSVIFLTIIFTGKIFTTN